MTSRGTFGLVAVAVLAASLVTAAGPAQATPKVAERTITLVTGDKVRLAGNAVTGVQAGNGRQKIPMFRQVSGQHRYVIPADAAGLVTTGKLDRQLFDVDELLSLGFDDAHTTELPVIVQYDQKVRPALAGARVKRDVPGLGMTAVRAAKTTTFWQSLRPGPAMPKIWLDGKRKLASVSDNLEQIGAPTAWKAGYTGTGTTVAVLDGGIDATHPDFSGKIVAEQNFTDAASTDDTFGHGTHVASIAAGSGAASDGKYSGVAPGAKLAVGKVCDGNFCDESAIIAGMVWAARTVHAKVVNLSLGGPDTAGTDPLEATVNQLSETNGTLFVVAAGNSGGTATIGSPGSATDALTVGAVDGNDKLAPFSSRGPLPGDGRLKPDIVAPGVGIVAAKAKNGVIGDPSDNPAYVALDGTSMATPHVAGAAAILAGEHPDWTGQQLKSALMASAKPLSGVSVFGQGAGRLDVARAVGQELVATPPSVSVPMQIWPHTDDKPVYQTVSYHNYGKTPLVVALSAEVGGPDGKPAPAGMYAVAPKTLTIAAGADGAATLTTNTAVAGKDGQYTGGIVASTPGGQSVHTPVAVNREVESYNLTIRTIAPDSGPPPAGYLIQFVGYDAGLASFPDDGDADGTASARVPRGRYGIESLSNDLQQETSTDLVAPYVNVTHDTTVVMDTRKAKPSDITVDEPGAQSIAVQTNNSFLASPEPIAGSGVGAIDGAHLLTANIGAAAPATLYSQVITSDWAAPGPAGDFADSPYAYHLARLYQGRMPTGLVLHAKKSELSRVKQTVLPTISTGSVSRAAVFSLPSGVIPFQFAVATTSSAPGVVTQYLSPGAQRWTLQTQLGDANGNAVWLYFREPGTVVAGDSADVVNKPSFGPAFFPDTPGAPTLTRQLPNDLVAEPMMFSGGDQRYRGIINAPTSLVLYKDGVKVADGAEFLDYHAPSADAGYRLVGTQSQSLGSLSTTVSGEWTFRSTKTADQNGKALALLSPRFAPGKAASGSFDIPVAVDRQLAASKVASLTVEFSSDDGKTWLPATVRPAGSGWVASVTNPSNGFVSLRGAVADTDGNTAKVTIVRAYAIG